MLKMFKNWKWSAKERIVVLSPFNDSTGGLQRATCGREWELYVGLLFT